MATNPSHRSGKKASRKNTARRPQGEGKSARRSPRSAEKGNKKRTEPRHVFPVAGIGASAGGLEALKAFLQNLPADTGIAFVVVTHQHRDTTSMLPELLQKAASIPVVEAADGMALAPDRIHVAPPGVHLALLRGRLHVLEDRNKQEAPHLPIDVFFRSLAEDQKERAICIVLSGTGSDGTIGLRAIKGESGMAMVQEPKSAKYTGMPESALETGLADYVLPPAEMPTQLVAYARGSYLSDYKLRPDTVAIPAAPIEKILLVLRSRTGHDFSSYKMSTVRRRIERRMNVHQIRSPNEYVRFVQQNPKEIDVLFQELLISVTCFFRDPEAFEALRRKVLKDLLESLPAGSPFRVWVPACATGEQAYSFAILIRECLETLSHAVEVQIFATDLDKHAIQRARAGMYPDGIARDVSPERLERFFLREDGGYRIRKELREMVIFAPQNTLSDPPFTKLDLISCRNLLIYLDGSAQKTLLPTFHYALKPRGILFLGPSESIGNSVDLFSAVDAKWKIFRRRETATPPHPRVEPFSELMGRKPDQRRPEIAPPARGSTMSSLMERILLDRFAPASVLVDERGDVVYVHGRTGAYLEPATGQARMNLFEMAREGLQPALSALLREAAEQRVAITRENVRVKSNGGYVHVNLSVSKLREPQNLRNLLLVTFRTVQAPARPPRRRKGGRASDEARLSDLERDLRETKESLRKTVEDLETSNEELKSANEELQSMNEELQSTNEELETSKEEMQSLNEELSTVNTELQDKVDELAHANDDMQNLMNSIEVGTIFLDNDLLIKRYTEAARKLINIISTDIGRPIADLKSNIKSDGIEDDAREVLRTLTRKEMDVESVTGHWYLMRILPYRTAENVIDGVVLTFVEIDRLKQAERREGEGKRFIATIGDAMENPYLVLDADLRIISANSAFQELFRLDAKRLIGERLDEIGEEEWNVPKLKQLLKNAAKGDAGFDDFQIERSFPKMGRRKIILRGRPLKEGGERGVVLLEVKHADGSPNV